MAPSILVVVSEADPVASRVAERWGTPEATGGFIEGAPIRTLGPECWFVRRPGLHIHDEHVDRLLPAELRDSPVTLLFPSIHRSEQNVECLTVHPLGNLGAAAEVGGRPRTLVRTDPRRMTDALRRLNEGGKSLGLRATFEATHHGPEVGLAGFFVEIGYGAAPAPSEAAVRLLAEVIPEITPDAGDRIAIAVGGGHYAPHFTDLALRRRWAFGHILSRHALETLDATTARQAYAATPGAEGILYSRAEDAKLPALQEVGARLRDGEAPRR